MNKASKDIMQRTTLNVVLCIVSTKMQRTVPVTMSDKWPWTLVLSSSLTPQLHKCGIA